MRTEDKIKQITRGIVEFTVKHVLDTLIYMGVFEESAIDREFFNLMIEESYLSYSKNQCEMKEALKKVRHAYKINNITGMTTNGAGLSYRQVFDMAGETVMAQNYLTSNNWGVR